MLTHSTVQLITDTTNI